MKARKEEEEEKVSLLRIEATTIDSMNPILSRNSPSCPLAIPFLVRSFAILPSCPLAILLGWLAGSLDACSHHDRQRGEMKGMLGVRTARAVRRKYSIGLICSASLLVVLSSCSLV